MKYDFFLSGLDEPFKQKTLDAIRVIEEAKATGSIRNVVYNNAKDTLNRACSRANDKLRPDFDYEDASYEMRQFADNISYIDSLHSIIAIRKKVEKITERAPLVVYYDRISAELLDLALTMKDLKSKVVKGRVIKEPAPVNPNQIRKTCGCCFRNIAISDDKTMVHHGFQRPGNGYQTSSCPGINFKYFEISDDGPRYMVKAIKESLISESEALKNLKSAKSFNIITSNRFTFENTLSTLKEGDDGFDRYKESEVRKQEHLIMRLKRDLAFFEKKLKEWKPTESE
ncbi:hypothetical protein [Serratia sp. Se-RSBMAAmG]|uniref:hypothetical protein n=1 Tax=Serratia sp. Se-RSBMAAmG TaxID=3043305 RepID=UPI0024AE9ED2|nr:hypothetical protein [Serratia sp. Se-RSBMAAmG]MDI6977217.1 hypothetical protein [Serratia sp. Se-RSBMAAmG]